MVALLAVVLSSCSEKQSDFTQSFEVSGYVNATLDESNRLLIDHEEIPDYMPRMIMLFNVANPGEAAALKAGEEIEFTYKVEATRSWIENIRPTGSTRETNETNPYQTNNSANLLSTGDALPDFEFIDEEGDPVHLSDYRGSVVAITFIFTRCPVPEYCPTMMRNFGNVDEILKIGAPLETPWKLVTISFDPENDTPEVMKRYGQAFDYDPATWDLLTSKTLEPIEGIAAGVGLKYGKKDGSYLHNLRTVVLDPKGNIQHLFTSEDWSPIDLAAQMRAASQK